MAGNLNYIRLQADESAVKKHLHFTVAGNLNGLLLQADKSAVEKRAHLPQQDVRQADQVLVDCPPALPHLRPGRGNVMK